MTGTNFSDDLEATLDLTADERRGVAGQFTRGVAPESQADPAEQAEHGAQPADEIQTRDLVWADVTQVAALESELFGASAWTMGMLTEELRGVGRWYIGAHPVDDGGHPPLVGYGGLWFDGEDAHIMTIGVSPDHRGRGIGQTLMARLVEHARHVGAHSMLLEVAVNNPAAIAMYERAGFKRLGLRKRYYQPEDVDAYTMQLILKERTPPIGDLP